VTAVTSKPVVLISGRVTAPQLAQIHAATPGADVGYFANREDLEAQIEDAEVVAGGLTAAALARARQLKWVQGDRGIEVGWGRTVARHGCETAGDGPRGRRVG